MLCSDIMVAKLGKEAVWDIQMVEKEINFQ